MNKYTLELTEEELNFIYDRCSNKAARLEDVNLKDTPCYRLAHQVMHKIYESKKNINAEEEVNVAAALYSRYKLTYGNLD